jgi:hypothetical protein
MSFHGSPEAEITVPLPAALPLTMSEPVLGYRCWLVDHADDGVRLRGVTAPAHWASAPGAWTEAACTPLEGVDTSAMDRVHQFSAPHASCTCGLYAYHSLSAAGIEDGALAIRPQLQDQAGSVGLVWGAVIGAGRVLIYEDGWRAQHARPVALLRGSGFERHVRGVAAQLGIPVVPGPRLERLAKEFGQPRTARSIRSRGYGSGWTPPRTGRPA